MVDEGLCGVGEDEVEQVVLEVLSVQRFCVCALDGESFSAEVLWADGG